MCYYLQSNTQLYVITDKGVDDVWIKEAEYSGISSAVLNTHPCNCDSKFLQVFMWGEQIVPVDTPCEISN